jgi:Carboxypeptidase regulatory-like domain/Secretion system C-terminal sorting domain
MNKGLLLLLSLLLIAGTAFAVDNDVELKSLLEAHLNGAELSKTEFSLLRQAHLVGGSHNVIDHLGGPDAFGYVFKDSDEPDGPTFNWIDITATGTEVSESGGITDDDQIGPFPIGFNFPFYGSDRTQVYLHSNGVLSFDDWGWGASFTNEALPGTFDDLQGACICCFWDDFDPYHDTFADFDGGQIYYETVMLRDQNALVVSYVDIMQYPGAVDQDAIATFQVILFEDGTILCQYDSISESFEVNLDAETLGLVYDDLTIFLEASLFDTPIDYPFDGLALEYTMLPADASLSGTIRDSGNFQPIEGATVEVGYFSTVTDASGNYDFPELFSGTLSYEISAIGYVAESGSVTLPPGPNTQDFELDEFIAPAEVLIVDVDVTPDSGPAIETVLNDLGFTTYYTTDFFEMPLTGFEYVFLFVGIYPNDFMIDPGSAEEEACVDLLNAGGNLYIEGGDVFAFSSPDNLIEMLNIGLLVDGDDDLLSVLGEGVLEGLDMDYAGENEYMDQIEPINGAVRVLQNPADGAGCGVLDNSMTYNTACFSLELGMLVDGESTRSQIVEAVMENFGATAEPEWLTLDLIGQVVTIPPAGGTVIFDAILVSVIPNPILLDGWTFVTTPSGTMIGPLFNVNIQVVPGQSVVLGLPQSVPAMAPGGEYIYTAYIGNLPNEIGASDSFTFTKIGADPDGGGSWHDETWASAWIVDSSSSTVTLPSDYSMTAAYPNPFNPTTTITIALPEVAELSVSVFNVTGQLVTTLADGRTQAGTHSFTFDASGLASGLYFVRATVPGQLNSVQKVMLVQ